jgi:hypothetical protein
VIAAGLRFLAWGDALQQVWNSLAILLCVALVVGVWRVPTTWYSRGWRDKAWWISWTVIPTVSLAGLLVPIGALVAWPLFLRSLKRGRETGDDGRRMARDPVPPPDSRRRIGYRPEPRQRTDSAGQHHGEP